MKKMKKMTRNEDLEILVLQGTVREGNATQYLSEEVTRQLSSQGFNVDLFDPGEHDFPRMKTRRSSSDNEAVKKFGELLDNADCLVIVTPEYNHSVPGVLKDVLDHYYPEYDGMIFGYITVSAGGFGGVRAQVHLNEITQALGAEIGPKLPVSHVQESLTDNGVSQELSENVDEFVIELEEHLKQR